VLKLVMKATSKKGSATKAVLDGIVMGVRACVCVRACNRLRERHGWRGGACW
jgi:hypothetical protein